MKPPARPESNATLQATARTLARDSSVSLEPETTRGKADLAALSAAFQLSTVLAAHAPTEPQARALFVALARLRSELIAARQLPGLGRNTLEVRQAESVREHSMEELALRARLAGSSDQPQLSALECSLLAAIDDEPRFARLATELVSTLLPESALPESALPESALPESALSESPAHPSVTAVLPAPATTAEASPGEGSSWADYRVFTREFDQEVHIRRLYSAGDLRTLRRRLDALIAPKRAELDAEFRSFERRIVNARAGSWVFGQPDGVLDSARLAQVVAAPQRGLPFKRDEPHRGPSAAVTLLIDMSSSLRGTPIALAAVVADRMTRALERAGVKVELLGFTTQEWDGGAPYARWQEAGRPLHPGRLSSLRHVILKRSRDGYLQTRDNLGALFHDELLKENIDGEALLWARTRLRGVRASKRLLVLLTDGAPSCEATRRANCAGYLDAHLDEALAVLGSDKSIEFVALGLGTELRDRYPGAIPLSSMEDVGTALRAVLNDRLGLGSRRQTRPTRPSEDEEH